MSKRSRSCSDDNECSNCVLTLDKCSFNAEFVYGALGLGDLRSGVKYAEMCQNPLTYFGVLLCMFSASSIPATTACPRGTEKECPDEHRLRTGRCHCFDNLRIHFEMEITAVCLKIPEVKAVLKSNRLGKYYAQRLKRDHAIDSEVVEVVLEHEDCLILENHFGEDDHLFQDTEEFSKTAVSVTRFVVKEKKNWLLRIPVSLVYNALENVSFTSKYISSDIGRS